MARSAALVLLLALSLPPGLGAQGPSLSFDVTQLDNGLQVCVRRYAGAPTVGVAATVALSAIDEPEGWEGIRQLAQMCLVDHAKTTLAEAAVVISGEVQMDFVAFRARSLPSLWRRAVGALLDSVLHVHFDSNLVRAEQAVMRQMEGEANAAPAIVASRTGIQALYPAIERCGHPLVAWRPAATAYIRRFCQRNFRPNRITLTVSGPVDKEDVVAFVERATANLLPAPSGPSAGAPAMPARVGRKRLRVDGEGAAVWIGARMPRPSEADYPAAVVAAAIIGGGMGSRAFRRLRDDLSLAYTVGAQMVASDCCPHAFVLCMCRPADADRAADELNAQIDDLIAHGPKAWEVDRAREYCAAEAAQLAMSNWQAAAFIGAMAIMADRMPWIRGPSALSQAVRAVSMTDVQRIIRNWWARRATIVVVGK